MPLLEIIRARLDAARQVYGVYSDYEEGFHDGSLAELEWVEEQLAELEEDGEWD